jgi:hypothetical protein
LKEWISLLTKSQDEAVLGRGSDRVLADFPASSDNACEVYVIVGDAGRV